jgi:hypothetical protein
MKHNLSNTERTQILTALGINLDEVKKVLHITYDQICVKFVDGHSATFKITRNVSK